MPLLKRPSFASSPLLPTVPLDGTQKVTGLRELERQSRLQAPQRQAPASHSAAAADGRRSRFVHFVPITSTVACTTRVGRTISTRA